MNLLVYPVNHLKVSFLHKHIDLFPDSMISHNECVILPPNYALYYLKLTTFQYVRIFLFKYKNAKRYPLNKENFNNLTLPQIQIFALVKIIVINIPQIRIHIQKMI